MLQSDKIEQLLCGTRPDSLPWHNRTGKKQATYSFLATRMVRGYKGTRSGSNLGRVWDKSLLIVRLYQNGVGAKEICRYLFGDLKEVRSVLDCIKAHGVFVAGRRPPKQFMPNDVRATREMNRELVLGFGADMRQWRKGVRNYELAVAGSNWRLQHKRMMASPQRKLKFYMRKRLNTILNGERPYSIRSVELIGCHPGELRAHIEAQLIPGWNWENYGKTWQVDHIKPCAAFNLLDKEEAKKCFHFTNLRPLDRIENIKKSDRLPDGTRASHKAA